MECTYSPRSFYCCFRSALQLPNSKLRLWIPVPPPYLGPESLSFAQAIPNWSPQNSLPPKVQPAFELPAGGSLQIRVLAPGFAVETIPLPLERELTVRLHLAPAAETVVVTATRTPVPGEAAGSDVDTLTAEQLTTMQPSEAADAVRFLPGAVVNAAGQRGALTSLFVGGRIPLQQSHRGRRHRQ